MRFLILPLALALPTALMAEPPADNAPKLSQIAATIEAELGADLHYIESIEWDDDGYWEVEYRTRDGREIEIDVDPMTGRAR
jgi:uncharacterized membrane protein YkoI